MMKTTNTKFSRIAASLLLALAGVAASPSRADDTLYQATTKLLVTRYGEAAKVSAGRETADETFYETQAIILQSTPLALRVQQRLGRTTEDFKKQLTELEVARQGKSDVIVVSVTSPSLEFAGNFAKALVEEFISFREEQAARAQQQALLLLNRDVARLKEELALQDQRMVDYLNEQEIESGDDSFEWRMMQEERERLAQNYDAVLDKIEAIDWGDILGGWRFSVLEPVTVAPIGFF